MRGHLCRRADACKLHAYVGRDSLTNRKKYVTRTFHGKKRVAGVVAMAQLRTEGYGSATTTMARSAPEILVGSSTAGTGADIGSRKLCVRLWHAGMLLMIGLILGACGGSSPGSSSNARSVPTTSATSSTGALDACLVGTWIDRGESDTLSYNGTPLVMNGLVGKTVTFSPSDTETVSFSRATPLQGSVGGSIYVVTERGTISAIVSSNANVLSLSDVNYTNFTETATLGGTTTSPPEPPPPTPDRYTCNSTTMSLTGVGSHSTFRRSSAPASSLATTTSSSTAGSVPVPSSPSPTPVSTIPDLFVSTAATPPPGELFAWPKFPTTIQRNDNDWISGITWSAGPQSASGTGIHYTDLSCSGPAASCPPTAEGTVKFSATTPETCIVVFTNPSSGAQQSKQAYVYDHLQYTQVTGSQADQTFSLPSPCT